MAEDTSNGKLVLHYVNFLKNAFVSVLQAAFGSDFTPEEYRYAADGVGGRQLTIYRGFSNRPTKFPIIIVESDEGDVSNDKLGDEAIREEPAPEPADQSVMVFAVFAGNMTLPIRIHIEAETTTDREMLTDLVAFYVRYAFKNLFHKYNFSYLRISAGEDGEEDSPASSTGKIFKGVVRVTCFAEYEQKVSLAFLDIIENINLDGLLVGSSPSDAIPVFDEPEV
jgi:hypothetical protein